MEQTFRWIMRIPMVRWAKFFFLYLHHASAERLGLYKAEAAVFLIKKRTKNHRLSASQFAYLGASVVERREAGGAGCSDVRL